MRSQPSWIAFLSVSLLAACDVGTAGSGTPVNPGGGADAGGGPTEFPDAPAAVPKIAVAVDKATVDTDLLVEQTVTVTVTGSGGFAGAVTLQATAEDPAGAALSDWKAALSTSSLTLDADGTATATVKLSVPGDTAALAGKLKITATSSAGTETATSTVTATNVAVVTFTDTNGKCVYDRWRQNNPLKLKVGRKLKVVDGGTQPMQIHFDGGIAGVNHQGSPMAVGADYTQTVGSDGGDVTFYCHNAGGGAATDAGINSDHQRLVSVP